MSTAERHLRKYSEMYRQILSLAAKCGPMCAAETKAALTEAARICRDERAKVENVMAQEGRKQSKPEEIAW